MVYSTTLQSKFHMGPPAATPAFENPPIHPAIVHFPLTFLTTSYMLDILYALTTSVIQPTFLTTRFSSPSSLLDISRLSYWLLCAGLLTTIPAIMSGNIQLVGMIKKNGGPWAKDADGEQQNHMVPKIKQAITHALINDLVFLVGIYSWYIRKDIKNLGHTPSNVNMGISALLFPMLMGSAKLGGGLVYNHGVGLAMGRRKME